MLPRVTGWRIMAEPLVEFDRETAFTVALHLLRFELLRGRLSDEIWMRMYLDELGLGSTPDEREQLARRLVRRTIVTLEEMRMLSRKLKNLTQELRARPDDDQAPDAIGRDKSTNG